MERTLDRRVSFDERSRAYDVRALLDRTEPRSYTWGLPQTVLDQGPDGACVGFSWAHELACRPYVRPADYLMAMGLYRHAQLLDQWPGEAYEGTSVLAGAKAAREAGHLSEFRWAFSLRDALAAISRTGPAVVGAWWWSGMFRPDSSGFIHPTGYREGGHAVVVRGVNVRRRLVTVQNSWGPRWGGTEWGPGTALLSWDDFGTILADDGECCIPVERGA